MLHYGRNVGRRPSSFNSSAKKRHASVSSWATSVAKIRYRRDLLGERFAREELECPVHGKLLGMTGRRLVR